MASWLTALVCLSFLFVDSLRGQPSQKPAAAKSFSAQSEEHGKVPAPVTAIPPTSTSSTDDPIRTSISTPTSTCGGGSWLLPSQLSLASTPMRAHVYIHLDEALKCVPRHPPGRRCLLEAFSCLYFIPSFPCFRPRFFYWLNPNALALSLFRFC